MKIFGEVLADIAVFALALLVSSGVECNHKRVTCGQEVTKTARPSN